MIHTSASDETAPQGSPRRTGTVSSKPPRMRTACTECHAGKVRCSGEKTGCTRCRQNGLGCVYKLSMVGRTLKRRNDDASGGGRQEAAPSTAADGGRALGSPTPTSGSDTIQALGPELSEAESAQLVSSGNFFTSIDKPDYHNAAHVDFSDEVFSWNWDLPNSTSQHLSEDSMLLDTRSNKQYSSTAPTTATDPSLSNSAFLIDGDDGKERVAQLVRLCHIVHGLETHLQSRVRSLDEIMKVNKACLAEIIKFTSGKQKSQVCRCSFILITSCLDTILALFEDVIRSSGLDLRSSGLRSESRMPNLQFGVFELEPQEQLAITRRILARELQKYRDVVKDVAAEFQDSSADFLRKLLGQWCLSLAARLGQLPVALEKQGDGPTGSSSTFGQTVFI